MIRIIRLFSLLVAFVIMISFNSCSKDHDDDPVNEEVTDSQSRRFVGTWSDNPNDKWPVFWTFNADGSCTRKSSDFHGDPVIENGQWSYATDANVLVTTLGMEWDIITVTDDYWSGRFYSNYEHAYVTRTYVRVR